ncbi:ribonuclease H [Marseillevirus marseillevirus]|uniref:ribonuclease H n=1 Tax=Marseillevirus marseillevirus TaxID=694581 RepID=D2XAD4_GBMV|nr:Rnase H [Marseillevirus marseillevirus]YP_009094616.1 Rnase H [Melbournevirus]ADB03911.1 ribonuclease H [Marseillevirus marseillevirus]AIT54728.1 ribonuclease H [Melbournevirus]
MYQIYTDGSCLKNPGKGGYGVVITRNDEVLSTLSGHMAETTNNQAEAAACIVALSWLSEPTEVEICSDSKYVVDGITKWIGGWKKNGWRTANKKPVLNKEFWLELDRLNSKHKVTWTWVARSSHEFNVMADKLANDAAKEK